MLILLLPLLVGFGLGPMLTHELRKESYARSRDVIAVDNAGIVFGRNVERLVAQVETRRKEVQWLERAHHQAHAKIPEEDLALEVSLEALIQSHWVEWEANWRESFYQAENEAGKLGVRIAFSGDLTFPWERRRCRVCGKHFDLGERPGRFPLLVGIRSRSGRGSIEIQVAKRYRLLAE